MCWLAIGECPKGPKFCYIYIDNVVSLLCNPESIHNASWWNYKEPWYVSFIPDNNRGQVLALPSEPTLSLEVTKSETELQL